MLKPPPSDGQGSSSEGKGNGGDGSSAEGTGDTGRHGKEDVFDSAQSTFHQRLSIKVNEPVGSVCVVSFYSSWLMSCYNYEWLIDDWFGFGCNR